MKGFRRLPWRIARMWAMGRLYWGGCDWDWYYIIELMDHQIRRTRLHVAKHQGHEGWERDVRNMKKTEALLKASMDGNVDDWDELLMMLRCHMRQWWD